MNISSNRLTGTVLSLRILTIACLALPRFLQAVSPPPDGGYPGGNTAEGQNALFGLTSGGYNTAVGFLSLRNDSVNGFNTAIGAGTLLANTADQNTATGAGALLSNTTGTGNTATGAFALFANTTGSDNTALGSDAGAGVTTGSGNICIGALVSGAAGENNTVRIGDNLPSSPGQSACYIGGIVGQAVDPGSGTTLYIDASGKLGMFFSSQRFKRDIKSMNNASEAILALNPVSFYYKSDAKNTPCFGLIAEEVAKIDPALVVRDKEGKPYSVRYDQVNAMLLNEFLKEHKRVEQQEATIAGLKSTVASLVATVKDQAAEIQKVSAQLELSKPVPKTVLNNQ